MGRPPCCNKANVKRGPWTPEEDAKILAYVASHGIGNWTLVPQKAGMYGLYKFMRSCQLMIYLYICLYFFDEFVKDSTDVERAVG